VNNWASVLPELAYKIVVCPDCRRIAFAVGTRLQEILKERDSEQTDGDVFWENQLQCCRLPTIPGYK